MFVENLTLENKKILTLNVIYQSNASFDVLL